MRLAPVPLLSALSAVAVGVPVDDAAQGHLL